MIDLVKLRVSAGNGGDGRVSFLRAKFVPKGGPDGGDGGDGGNLYLVGNKNHSTLQLYAGKKAFSAEAGEQGGARNSYGKKGEDLYLEVPVGTVVWKVLDATQDTAPVAHNPEDQFDQVVLRHADLSKTKLQDVHKEKVAEVLQDGEVVLLCQGGKGGRGNERFKSSTNTTPMQAEKGTKGEVLDVFFELKLLADLGLVGFPNAGKSTFLSLVTKANPRIANYPFTTLEPNLGVLELSSGSATTLRREIVVADIPGLIEGASEGKGLGIQFLRHIERCRALMYVLYLEEAIVYDDTLTDAQKVDKLSDQLQALQAELQQHDQRLMDLPTLITVNKSDLYTESLVEAITAFFARKKIEVTVWSGATTQGLDLVKDRIQSVLK